MDFGETIELWGDCTGRVHFVIDWVLESTCLFNILEYVSEFVFEFVGGVLGNAPVSIGVTK